MKCQILFSGKNKKSISKCHLLKILPSMLSVKIGDEHIHSSVANSNDILKVTFDNILECTAVQSRKCLVGVSP